MNREKVRYSENEGNNSFPVNQRKQVSNKIFPIL